MSAGERAYPPIASLAFLSDMHTAALLGPDGAVEWLCVPRFDGGSVFARLLDREHGGAFVLDIEDAGRPERRYLGDTLAVESRFEAPTGTAVVDDFLAVRSADDDNELTAVHVLVRRVRCESGSVKLRAQVDARPDYGRKRARWERKGADLWETADPRMWLSSTLALESGDHTLSAAAELSAGDVVAFALGYTGESARPVDVSAAEDLLEETKEAWRRWAGHCHYDGFAREQVIRSALVLRGLAFDETGALLAAPTTSLPEWIGGGRNWDYRFTWHRDASLLVLALFRLGHAELGRRYARFLFSLEPVRQGTLTPMAGIGGELASDERVLDHLDGYAASRPVRVGNEAFDQVQFESYGHVLDAAYVYYQLTGEMAGESWAVLRRLVATIGQRWREPDHGIWEMRGEKRQNTYSKVMAWVCVDRGIRLAERLSEAEIDEGEVDGWRKTRDEIKREVLDRGYSEERGAFVQVYDGTALDAALLHIPLFGFLPGDDPRVVSTIDRIIEGLGDGDALIHRYDLDEVDDGLDGPEGAFLLCSFDLVSALVLAGRAEEAERRFDRLMAYAGPLGLFAEEARSTGAALGNYPQAFAHLALIQAALNLDAAGDEDALHAFATRTKGKSWR
ncbi:glycoside hydrolase family 15 protein [Nocardia coubleae]|uniref:Glycoside hydrolase family 15 protein n=1 Tax=Nocardia coubleae TaxID=356147 RepID=A0A846W8B8_9NOCA|nr:glycoside hydrolase family 15 protein [Nocardia coubleae]NKX88956.1 glycoside hydrolase family 15 protein [Nocardia coubleae]